MAAINGELPMVSGDERAAGGERQSEQVLTHQSSAGYLTDEASGTMEIDHLQASIGVRQGGVSFPDRLMAVRLVADGRSTDLLTGGPAVPGWPLVGRRRSLRGFWRPIGENEKNNLLSPKKRKKIGETL